MEAFERKELRYAAEARERGWQNTHKFSGDVRDFVAKSTTTLLLDFGFRGRSLKGALWELSKAAEKVSQWFWLRPSQTTWGQVN